MMGFDITHQVVNERLFLWRKIVNIDGVFLFDPKQIVRADMKLFRQLHQFRNRGQRNTHFLGIDAGACDVQFSRQFRLSQMELFPQ